MGQGELNDEGLCICFRSSFTEVGMDRNKWVGISVIYDREESGCENKVDSSSLNKPSSRT
jgi:hypothetical protein